MPEPAPDVTSMPGSLSETSVSTWMEGIDGTSAEPIVENDERYASSSWELLDKHFMHGGLRTPVGIALATAVVGLVILIGWIFVQDNGAGRLETDAGIARLITKARYAILLVGGGTAVVMLLGFASALARRARHWFSRSRK